MANLLADEAPLTPPHGVTVLFQNEDGTWPSAQHVITTTTTPAKPKPKPRPKAASSFKVYEGSTQARLFQLERNIRDLSRSIDGVDGNCSDVFQRAERAEEYAVECFQFMEIARGRLQQLSATSADLLQRVASCENKQHLLDSRLDTIEHNLREGVYASEREAKRRKLLDWEFDFGAVSE